MATVSPQTKQVHFPETTDWDEENRRSAARFEKRRKDKESIRMASQQKELRMLGIVAVISNVSNWHDLSTLCFSGKDEIAKISVWALVLGRGECNSTKLARSLVRFGKKDHTALNTLNPDQIEALEVLNVSRKFCNEFRRQIALATAITSGSEEEPETTRRDAMGRSRRERRRGWAQRGANARNGADDDNNNNGGPAIIPRLFIHFGPQNGSLCLHTDSTPLDQKTLH